MPRRLIRSKQRSIEHPPLSALDEMDRIMLDGDGGGHYLVAGQVPLADYIAGPRGREYAKDFKRRYGELPSWAEPRSDLATVDGVAT